MELKVLYFQGGLNVHTPRIHSMELKGDNALWDKIGCESPRIHSMELKVTMMNAIVSNTTGTIGIHSMELKDSLNMPAHISSCLLESIQWNWKPPAAPAAIPRVKLRESIQWNWKSGMLRSILRMNVMLGVVTTMNPFNGIERWTISFPHPL